MTYENRMMNIPSFPEASEPYKCGHRDARHEAAEIATEADAIIARLTAERDKALRRRDAWKERAANHVEIVNALNARTKGGDSRTLSRALIGAAMTQLEEENEGLRAALRYGCGAAINSLVDDGLPPEWSEGSGIATMLRALGCDSLTLDDDARAALSGEAQP
jgi:hypothetical protein